MSATKRLPVSFVALLVTIVLDLMQGQNHIFAKGEFNDVSQGETVVSKDSSFCDWSGDDGPICTYNGTDREVLIPEGLELLHGQFMLEVDMAKAVHLYPVCIPYIKMNNVDLVKTLQGKDPSTDCRSVLKMSNSQADDLDSYGLSEVYIWECSVNTITLFQQKKFTSFHSTIESIDVLHLDDGRGNFHNTTVNRIKQVVAEGDWWVTDSHFDDIFSGGIVFNAQVMELTNSSISRISPQGLKIRGGGTVTFSNVIIDRLESSAIVVEDVAAILVLSNVTINSASTSCIVLPDRERISFKDVTIGEILLNSSSAYLKFEDDIVFPENVTEEVFVEGELTGCSSLNSSLICDFSSIDNESIEIDASHIEGYQLVQIKNAKFLQVLSTGCNLELQLQSVNGTLPHFATEVETNSTMDNDTYGEAEWMDACGMTLSVLDSHLEVISGKYVSNMTITNSTLGRLHEGKLESFNVQNVTVGTLDSINISGTRNTWTRMEVESVFNLTLQAPVKAENIVINRKLRKGSLIIDHANSTTEISGGNFHIMVRDALIVKRGKLVLRNLHVDLLSEGAIHVEEGASLEIDHLSTDTIFNGVISVATRDQVKLDNSGHNKNMIHVRAPPPPLPDMESNLTLSDVYESPFCSHVQFKHVCDFSRVKNASVIVHIKPHTQSAAITIRGHFFFKTPHVVEIREASLVTLYPSCADELHLQGVVEATTVDSESGCQTWLQANGVRFKNITGGVHDVTLTSCSVELISLNRVVRDIDLEDTNVKKIAGLHWSEFQGEFRQCSIDEVEGLVVSYDMIMIDTKVKKILPNGITVLSKGEISQSVISEVASGGMTVKGELRMNNVAIGNLAKNAIVVNEGVLFLCNVSINTSDEMSIIATVNGAVAMQNVTVAGKKIQWHGYIVDSLGQNDPSVVFVNKYSDAVHRGVPKISSAPHVTKSSTFRPSAVTNSPQKSPSPTSWKWATVVLIVLLVLLLLYCIYFTMRMRKSGKTMMPRVFWQAKHDQTNLLEEDQTL